MNIIEVESFGVIPLSQQEGVWKVLLILHKEGSHWSFPKGRRDYEGEAPLDAALRELQEETGLKVVRLLQNTALLERYTFRRKGEVIKKTVHYYPALVSGTLLLQEEEIREALWLCMEEALRKLTFKEARSLCRYVMKCLPKSIEAH